MFENRINNFAPNVGAAGFTPGVFPMQRETGPQPNPIGVQVNDIYQAAMKRAVEDHEIDKLFNPEPDDYQI